MNPDLNLGPFDNAFFMARAFERGNMTGPSIKRAEGPFPAQGGAAKTPARKYSMRARVEWVSESVPGGRAAEPIAGLVNCAISGRNFSGPSSSSSAISGTIDFLKFCYDQAPVVGFKVFRNDAVTVRAARFPDELAARLENAGPRGEIEYLSAKSRRRLALVAGNSPVVFRSFVTVSYPENFPCDGRLVKRHLSRLLKSLRRKCPALEYLWFLEFQRRGAPHFHAFLDFALPEPLATMKRKNGRTRKDCQVNWELQDWISARWFEIVGSGDEKHLHAGAAWEVVEKPDGAARYVAKESYKTFQKQVPKNFQNVGRFWGTSKNVTPAEGEMIFASQADMARIFGKEAMDSEGNPYPVLFSAAAAYEKIRDTPADPAKSRSWNTGHSQKYLLSPKSGLGLGTHPGKRRIVSEE